MERISDLPVSSLLTSLGARTPSPGGGASAALAGALAAATARMVLSYSIGRKSLAEHEPTLQAAAQSLDRAHALLLELGDEDAEAYERLNATMKLRETDPRRDEDLPRAVAAAIAVPSAVLAAGIDLLRLLETLPGRTNPHLRSDLAVAAVLAEASVRAAAWNIEVNLPLVADEAERKRVGESVRGSVNEAGERATSVERACRAQA